MFVDTLQPWVHYVPVDTDLSNIVERFQWVLDHPDESKHMISTANAWCAHHLQYSVLQDYFLSTVEEYLHQLDAFDANWQTAVWKSHEENMYVKGHFFLQKSHAYSLPKPTVGAIKQGLRRDDPNYNETSQLLER